MWCGCVLHQLLHPTGPLDGSILPSLCRPPPYSKAYPHAQRTVQKGRNKAAAGAGESAASAENAVDGVVAVRDAMAAFPTPYIVSRTLNQVSESLRKLIALDAAKAIEIAPRFNGIGDRFKRGQSIQDQIQQSVQESTHQYHPGAVPGSVSLGWEYTRVNTR